MNLVRWGPFRDLVSLRQAMDGLFEDGFYRPFRVGSIFNEGPIPAVDVYDTAKEVVVKAPLPGVKPEDVDISITDNILDIRGEAKVEQGTDEENCLHRECHYGAFARRLTLPPASR